MSAQYAAEPSTHESKPSINNTNKETWRFREAQLVKIISFIIPRLSREIWKFHPEPWIRSNYMRVVGERGAEPRSGCRAMCWIICFKAAKRLRARSQMLCLGATKAVPEPKITSYVLMSRSGSKTRSQILCFGAGSGFGAEDQIMCSL